MIAERVVCRLNSQVDRDTARIKETENDIFDLFALLGATDDQLNFPTLYASGREGWAVRKVGDQRQGMAPLLDTIIEHVPPPTALANTPHFAMLVTIIQKEAFLGRLVTGRIASGTVRVGDPIHTLNRTGTKLETAKVTRVRRLSGCVDVDNLRAHCHCLRPQRSSSSAACRAWSCHRPMLAIL